MFDTDTILADYTLRPSELASVLALLVEAREPCILCNGDSHVMESSPFCSTPSISGASPGATGKKLPKRVTIGRHDVLHADQAYQRAALVSGRIRAGEEPLPLPLSN